MKITFVLRFLLILLILFTACKKQVIQTDKIETPELSPSFAIPLGYANLNLGDIERRFDGQELVFNQANQLFELVYQRSIFEFTAADYFQFATQNFSDSYSAPPSVATAINVGGAGATASWQEQLVNTLSFSNGESIDSVLINTGNLTINVNSEFSHDISINLSSPYIVSSAGSALNTTIDLDYQGMAPLSELITVDLSGYTIDFTRNGITTNEIELNATLFITSSGAPITGSENITFASTVNLTDYAAVYGYFGQFTTNLNGQTDIASFYENFNGGTLSLADPRLELFLFNTTGIEVATDFSAIFELADNSNVINSGAGLTNIPNLAPALFVGDTAVTTYQINNGNTNPTLTNMLNQAPTEIVFATNSTVNPTGIATNFLTKESKVWATANAVLPFFGYADNFSLNDTTDLDLEEELALSPQDNFTVEDVEKLTVRIITKNSLPVTGNVQLYFADSLGTVIDSLFTTAQNGENIIQGAPINTSLPISDPNYGKVTNSVEKTTDIVLTGQKLKSLIDQGSKKLIYSLKANTTDASNQTDIKFFPEYDLFIKVSAKIDFKLNLQQ